MSSVVAPCRPADLPTLRALARHPSLADEFEPLQTDSGFDDLMGEPRVKPELRWIASVDGMPAGFCFAFLAETHGGAFAMIRLGVIDRWRQRGLGSALLSCCMASLEPWRERAGLREVNLSAWDPNPAAARFAARHGYTHRRNFWRMERARAPVPAPAWPDGVAMRTYDGSEASLAAFHDVYNRSFDGHYHYVRTSLEETRSIVAGTSFSPDGLALAHRDGAYVGFCRNARHGPSGEIALLGVVPEARGIGLGRALLRWGVSWLEARDADPLFLLVDGENEGALALYRSEGFTVARTRLHWGRAF
jgi:mycothiol synthase